MHCNIYLESWHPGTIHKIAHLFESPQRQWKSYHHLSSCICTTEVKCSVEHSNSHYGERRCYGNFHSIQVILMRIYIICINVWLSIIWRVHLCCSRTFVAWIVAPVWWCYVSCRKGYCPRQPSSVLYLSALEQNALRLWTTRPKNERPVP